MGLAHTLSDRPAVTNTITVAVILAALAFIGVDLVRSPTTVVTGQRLYFTTDDGRTYFPEAASRRPPFDAGGQPAVRAYVYATPGGKPFVAYLERLTPEALAKLAGPGGAGVERDFIVGEGTEVKRPGEADWVKRSGDAGDKILAFKPPAGESGEPELVLPGD